VAWLNELPKEAEIILEPQSQIVHAVTQHRQPVRAHAEREALIALRIDVDGAQHVRMHLPGTRDLEPAVAEIEVDLGRRLGERKERRTETHLQLVALEEATQELGEDAFQV